MSQSVKRPGSIGIFECPLTKLVNPYNNYLTGSNYKIAILRGNPRQGVAILQVPSLTFKFSCAELIQDRFQNSGQTISKYVFLILSLESFLVPNYLVIVGHITSNPKFLPFFNKGAGYATPIHWISDATPIHWISNVTPIHWISDVTPIHWISDATPIHWISNATPIHLISPQKLEPISQIQSDPPGDIDRDPAFGKKWGLKI
ncbi:hypothetical protein VP01_1038g14 [Puccinia sorghi]|uniref:Uncharacterized protein n=1 Tax=Puccinia sorghi TaxID=27349 RepID=A0A0L6VVW2_9BASI|nr:hypothetical protein VP01_1038g14 [Puccinia sorghi]